MRSSGKMSCTLVRESVKKALNSIGLEDDKYYRVHSVRSGDATAAANAGMEKRAFKPHGRWQSECAKDGYVKYTIEYHLSVSKNLEL